MRSKRLLLSIMILAGAGAGVADARPLERVPQDGTLEQAIRRVSDRGVIEIADGVYPAPAGGFEIDSPGKSFTVRAANRATVVLDGQGSGPILVYQGDGAGSGRRVSFERLVFRNGRSDSTIRGGAVTVADGDAVFVSSTFEDNANFDRQSRGGGAVQIRDGSFVRFTNCDFTGNTAELRGGAVYLSESTVGIVWSRFSNNRTNLPGHRPVSAGGALFALDAEPPADTVLTVTSSRFEGNEAGFAGGALNALGVWQDPLETPAVRIVLTNSTFIANRVDADSCCPPPTVAVGGAAHIEDHVTLEIESSRFEGNAATWGGALSSFRALLEVDDSVFRGNRAGVDPSVVAVGGTIALTSSDGATDMVNRRNAGLVMTHSLVEGPGAPVEVQQGGCLFANGDLNRMEGLNGVPQMGTVEDNRTRIELRDVVFDDCDVETSVNGRARGGAIFLLLADLVMEDSLITGSDALGDTGIGGGIAALDRTALHLTGTTFARNVAEERGGGLFAGGGEVEVDDCFFLENDVTPETAPGEPGEEIQQSTGAAINLSPDLGENRNITGVVQDSLFVGNIGIPIEDIDLVEAGRPFNLVRYDSNEFRSTAFGNKVFKNNLPGVALGGLTVAELNSLVIDRPGGEPPTDKSTRNNTFLASDPRTGRLVAAPSRVLRVGAAGDPATPSAFLGHAWSGGSATLAGENLAASSGVVEITAAGSYPLRVDGQVVTRATIEEGGCSAGRLLCLNRERFLIEVDWRDFVGNFGNAFVAPVGADDSGLYFFFDADNWEILVKVLNGCGLTDHFWLFSAATTNVEYTLRITDTVSGLTKSYFNALGAAAAAVTDTTALAACDAMGGGLAPEEDEPASLLAELRALVEDPVFGEAITGDPRTGSGKQGDCTPGPTDLCLVDSRFQVEVEWKDFVGNTGAGEVVPFGTDGSGLFFFFDPDNWEMLVKVLNGCGFNDRYWVFAAATTNVEYTLRVTDTEHGNFKEYFNPLGTAALAITDTDALDTCP